MKIEVYIICRNEEKLINYIVRHYSQFAKIFIVINNCTDNTIEIAHKLGCEVWEYKLPDEFDETQLMEIRNNCWKNSNANWVMVVDADEFIYHPKLVHVLKTVKFTVIETDFWNMFSENFPTTDKQIYDEVQYGVSGTTPGHGWKNKMNIFNPQKITDMQWGYGLHYSNPKGEVKIVCSTQFKTLHMKFLSRQYTIERIREAKNRLSKKNIKLGIGIHYKWDEQYINNLFDECKTKLIKVV